jgi:hypothetical protein
VALVHTRGVAFRHQLLVIVADRQSRLKVELDQFVKAIRRLGVHFRQIDCGYFAVFFSNGDLIHLRRDNGREVLILLGNRDWLQRQRVR